VWSFGHEDLQRFKANEAVSPPWFTEKAASTAMAAGNLRPALVRQLVADPITTLLSFITDPDLEAWEAVGRWLPMAFVRGHNRVKGDGNTVAASALTLLDGGAGSFGTGTDMCWSYVEGPLVVTAAMRPDTRALSAVLVVDDRDDRLEIHDGRAWKEWLRLSNWLGFGSSHRITTRSLLEHDATAPTGAPDAGDLSPAWQVVFDSTVSDVEKRLVLALATTDLPVPVLGYETEDGAVVDFAWGDSRVGVLLDPDEITAHTMSEAGWTLCPPDAEQIATAIKKGVV
jgi:hypothetical protein